jgi:hypothetical protein
MPRFAVHTFLAETFTTKGRLVDFLNQDRKEVAGEDASTKDSKETTSLSKRVARFTPRGLGRSAHAIRPTRR